VKVDRAFLWAWRAGRWVPGPVVRALTSAGADIAWLARGAGVRQLEANLARVRPELDARALRRLSRAGMRSYLRYYGEAFTLSASSREQIDARVRQPHLDAGRSAALALSHMGNWDLAGAWATHALAPVVTVAERLEPEELFQEFVRFREGVGLRIIPLTGGGDVFRQLVRAMREGGVLVPLLADRDLTANGVEVTLFGTTARVAVGPAALAVSLGAPLFAVAITYERLRGARRRAAGTPWGIVLDFMPIEVPPAGLTSREQVQVMSQSWVQALEQAIARDPQDWHMLQKVFVEDLDADRYAATVAAQEEQ